VPRDTARRVEPVTKAAQGHGRRKFFVLADVDRAPLAIEAAHRLAMIVAIKYSGRSTARNRPVDPNGTPPIQRIDALQQSASLCRAKIMRQFWGGMSKRMLEARLPAQRKISVMKSSCNLI